MSKKRWEDETLKPTLDKYPERDEVKLDERERLNTQLRGCLGVS